MSPPFPSPVSSAPYDDRDLDVTRLVFLILRLIDDAALAIQSRISNDEQNYVEHVANGTATSA